LICVCSHIQRESPAKSRVWIPTYGLKENRSNAVVCNWLLFLSVRMQQKKSWYFGTYFVFPLPNKPLLWFF
jgi:hypothetical protein